MQISGMSTDQIAAFVELARHGNLRSAAGALHITEQGARNRLLALEQKLGVELYRKKQGVRRTRLTEHGRRFLPHARAFLERAAELTELFAGEPLEQEIHVVASQYLILYVLIDAVRRFRASFPRIHVRLSARTEEEIEEELEHNPDVTIGVAAPYEPSVELEYRHLFAMKWSLLAHPRHALPQPQPLKLEELADQPLILFERGSTGRQHVMDAFHARRISPHVRMETTNTEIIVRMVEAGLGLAIVPLLESGAVTRGRRVGIAPLGNQVRAINSGILVRKGETLSPAAREFIAFAQREFNVK